MSFFRLSAVMLPIVLASCAAPPPPAPAPVVAPVRSRPAPPPVAASSDWRDWPVTPGDWSYAADARGSTARFGRTGAMPLLTLRCERAGRSVTLALAASAAGSATVRTSSTARTLPLAAAGTGLSAAVLAGNDPLLDAMGFSRGRFVIQQAGGATLVVPAWAEVLRVAEDCRS